MTGLADRAPDSLNDPLRLELAGATRRVADLEAEVRRLRAQAEAATSQAAFTQMPLAEVEAHLVAHAMERFRGNVSRAARALGLSRAALYRRLERHGIPGATKKLEGGSRG